MIWILLLMTFSLWGGLRDFLAIDVFAEVHLLVHFVADALGGLVFLFESYSLGHGAVLDGILIWALVLVVVIVFLTFLAFI